MKCNIVFEEGQHNTKTCILLMIMCVIYLISPIAKSAQMNLDDPMNIRITERGLSTILLPAHRYANIQTRCETKAPSGRFEYSLPINTTLRIVNNVPGISINYFSYYNDIISAVTNNTDQDLRLEMDAETECEIAGGYSANIAIKTNFVGMSGSVIRDWVSPSANSTPQCSSDLSYRCLGNNVINPNKQKLWVAEYPLSLTINGGDSATILSVNSGNSCARYSINAENKVSQNINFHVTPSNSSEKICPGEKMIAKTINLQNGTTVTGSVSLIMELE